MKINMGCGEKKFEGYLNVDNNPKYNPDANFDIFSIPLPFNDSEVDEIILFHTFEHCPREVGLINYLSELHRICKNGAIIKIKVPHVSDYGALHSPFHHYFFKSDTLNFIDKRNQNFAGERPKGDFEVKSRINSWLPFVNKYKHVAEKYIAKIIPLEEVEFELKVLK